MFGNKYYKKIVDIFIDKNLNKKLHPRYAHDGDAGMDVFAAGFAKFYSINNDEVEIDAENVKEFKLHPGQRLMINTGIKADIPKRIGIFALSRSGLSTKHGIILVNGVGTVDNIYKGYWCFTFANISGATYTFNIGDKIGQVVPFDQIKLNTIYVDSISTSERGETGFGQSGK